MRNVNKPKEINRINIKDYIYIFKKKHPFANKQGLIREHRFLIEQWLIKNDPKNINLIMVHEKLYLNPIAVVHHINLIKTDNRIKNLKLFSNHREHTSFHHKIRPDTERRKKTKISLSHPMISAGTKERTLLLCMLKYKDSRFNVKAYSRVSEMKRSTVYYYLDNLILKGLITKHHAGNYKINEKGENYLDMTLNKSIVSDKSRSVCHEDMIKSGINLSTHYQKYTSVIVDKDGFHEDKLNNLNALNWKKVELKNLTQYYLFFEDATIVINPKMIIVRIKDLFTKNTEDSQFKSFNKVLKYVTKLSEIGIELDCLKLDKVHYARVKSIFSDILKKLDDRYYIDLDDGKKFWIDYSIDEGEDETNDVLVREKIDNLLIDVSKSENRFKDIDKIIEALGMIAKIESTKHIDQFNEIKNNKKLTDFNIDKNKPQYFG